MEGRSPGSDGLDGAGLGLGIQSAGRGSYPPVPGVSDDTRDTTYGSDGTALHIGVLREWITFSICRPRRYLV